MFRRLLEVDQMVACSIDGGAVVARGGDTVAAAMLAAGHVICRRSAISDVARAPYCMMGVCFDCLVTVDGVQNMQACLVIVEEGMRIEQQQGKRRLVSEEI